MGKGKLYVSIPITGRDLVSVKEHAGVVKKLWEERGYEVVTPFELVEENNGSMGEKEYYAYCMGRCVEALLMCDGIVLCHGWFESKGCRAECDVAQVYGKMIRVDKTEYAGNKI